MFIYACKINENKSITRLNELIVFICVAAQNSLNGNLCPPLGLRVPFEIAIIQAAKKLFGCTYLERNISISSAPILNLWLERPVIIGKHGHCRNVNSTYNELLLLMQAISSMKSVTIIIYLYYIVFLKILITIVI
jgi:hypothetical protein